LSLLPALLTGKPSIATDFTGFPLHPRVHCLSSHPYIVRICPKTRLVGRISIAFVYGSLARQEEKTVSDFDLMVVGKASLEELIAQLTDIEPLLGRTIKPILG
jgi:predicted nucleotidyltransferase